MSHLDRFMSSYRQLREGAGWFGPNHLVSASQAALLVAADADAQLPALPAAIEAMKQSAGWFNPLRGMIGESIAAVALIRGADPGAIPERAKAIKGRFKAHGLRGAGGLWGAASSAWLALEDDAAVERALPRMGAIMAGWKEDHPWVTGGDDLHAAALHALGDREPAQIRRDVEHRFQALKGAGYRGGANLIQRGAQLAALRHEVPPKRLEATFRGLQSALVTHRRWSGHSARDAVVLLATLDEPANDLARELDAAVEEMKGVRMWIGAPVRFTLAAGLMVADREAGGDSALSGVTLAAIIAAINAQAAAAAAAAAS